MGAALTAIGATFSHLLGLVVFPIGVIQLVWLRKRASNSGPPSRALSVWLFAGALAYTTYFFGYHLPAYNPSRTHALSHPWEGAAFFFAALGCPWAVEPTTALVTGVVLGVGYVACGFALRRQPTLTLIAPAILLSLGSAALVAIGRSGFRDLSAAIPLRYTTYATPGLAALYLWALLRASSLPRAKLVLVSWLAVGSVATPAAMLLGLGYAREQSAFRRTVARGLVSHGALTDEDLMLVCPWDPTKIRVQAAALERVGWSVFHGIPEPAPAPLLAGSTPFTVDMINGVNASSAPIQVPSADAVVVDGWAVDEQAGLAAGGVRIGIDGRNVTAAYGIDRIDVAESLGNQSYRYSGFRAVFPPRDLRAGTHQVSIEVLAADGRGRYVSASSVEIEITE